MSDESDMVEEAGRDEEPAGPVCGERLAEARRKLQISVVEIAKDLHLDDFKVRALENNEFDVIGAPVFAKGHLRKYAQLVRVDENDVMADYYQLERAAGSPLVVSRGSRPRRSIALGPWIATIVVIAIAASGYWWFMSREVPAARPVTGAVTPLPQETDAAVDEAAGSNLVEQPVTTEAESEPEPEVIAPPDAVTDDPDMRLSISFSGDCWTEITDATGRRLFYELGTAGRTVDLTGEAPFNVLFGDADNVSLVVDGESFAIPASNRRGQTASLTITGP